LLFGVVPDLSFAALSADTAFEICCGHRSSGRASQLLLLFQLLLLLLLLLLLPIQNGEQDTASRRCTTFLVGAGSDHV
jgi:hypothetical protein